MKTLLPSEIPIEKLTKGIYTYAGKCPRCHAAYQVRTGDKEILEEQSHYSYTDGRHMPYYATIVCTTCDASTGFWGRLAGDTKISLYWVEERNERYFIAMNEFETQKQQSRAEKELACRELAESNKKKEELRARVMALPEGEEKARCLKQFEEWDKEAAAIKKETEEAEKRDADVEREIAVLQSEIELRMAD